MHFGAVRDLALGSQPFLQVWPPQLHAVMPTEIMAHFKPEIGLRIRPRASVEGDVARPIVNGRAFAAVEEAAHLQRDAAGAVGRAIIQKRTRSAPPLFPPRFALA